MEPISKNQGLKKYSKLQSGASELVDIKNKITKLTGIEPESVMIRQSTIIVKAKNNYEALELRSNTDKIMELLKLDKIKITA